MKYLFVFSILFFSSCGQKARQLTTERATYIRELAKRVGTQQLPFEYDMAKGNPDSRYNINKYSLDTLFFDDLNGRVGGVLPDTSRYYGFIYYKVGDSLYPFLLIISKKGKVIDRKPIGIGHCGGLAIDIESCVDKVSINKELEIDLLYTMRGTAETNDAIPKTIKTCNSISGKGTITKEGKIKITKGELEVCQYNTTINQSTSPSNH
ncbi:MAG: hypothetical protein ACKOE6_06860 [Flammeovirgaceae bacterium]